MIRHSSPAKHPVRQACICNDDETTQATAAAKASAVDVKLVGTHRGAIAAQQPPVQLLVRSIIEHRACRVRDLGSQSMGRGASGRITSAPRMGIGTWDGECGCGCGWEIWMLGARGWWGEDARMKCTHRLHERESWDKIRREKVCNGVHNATLVRASSLRRSDGSTHKVGWLPRPIRRRRQPAAARPHRSDAPAGLH